MPDTPDVLTSEEVRKLDNRGMARVRPSVATLQRVGCRVILFLDPESQIVPRVPGTGADGIEIYTGSYATASRNGKPEAMLAACTATARVAADLDLAVNNLANLPPLMSSVPVVAKASIGHELIADALVMGFSAAVLAYKAALGAL